MEQTGSAGRLLIAACFCQQALTIGVMFNLGMFTDYFRHSFSVNYAQVSLIMSLSQCVMYGGGPLSLLLLKRFGCKRVTMICSFMASSSFIISSFIPYYYLLVVLLGVIAGMACSVIFGASLYVIPEVFTSQSERLAAYAVAIAGAGMGNVLFPVVFTYFFTHYTWRQALFIAGAILLNFVPASMLMPARLTLHERPHLHNEKSEPEILWKNMTFVLTVVTCFLSQAFLAAAFYTFLSPLMMHHGFRSSQIGLVFLLMGAMSVPGRLAAIFTCRFFHHPLTLWCLTNVVCALIQAVLYMQVENWALTLCLTCVFSFCIGINYSLYPPVVSSLVTDINLHVALSVCNFAYGLGGLCGPVFVGLLIDLMDSYAAPLSLGSIVLLFMSLMLVFWDLTRSRIERRNNSARL